MHRGQSGVAWKKRRNTDARGLNRCELGSPRTDSDQNCFNWARHAGTIMALSGLPGHEDQALLELQTPQVRNLQRCRNSKEYNMIGAPDGTSCPRFAQRSPNTRQRPTPTRASLAAFLFVPGAPLEPTGGGAAAIRRTHATTR